MKGVLENLSEMQSDQRVKFGSEEMFVVLLCDGYSKMQQSFKQFGFKHGFYNEQVMIEDGYMKFVDGKCHMRQIDEIFGLQQMYHGFHSSEVPANFLHLFYVKTNLGMTDDNGNELPKVNFVFAVKQESRGKFDSF